MRIFLAYCLLGLSLTFHGATTATPTDQQAISADAQNKTEAQAYLAKIDDSLALGANGQYGTLQPGSAKKLRAERDRIAGVLANRTSFADLTGDDRLAIQNAEDAITAILRNKDKERMVCTREAKIGTRFATKECMTVSQREARASSAAEAVGEVQRGSCVPSESNKCGGR